MSRKPTDPPLSASKRQSNKRKRYADAGLVRVVVDKYVPADEAEAVRKGIERAIKRAASVVRA